MHLFEQIDNIFMLLENGCVTSEDDKKQYCYYMLLLNEAPSPNVTNHQKAVVTKLYSMVRKSSPGCPYGFIEKEVVRSRK